MEERDESYLYPTSAAVAESSSSRGSLQSADPVNSNYLKPFDLGWRRELVYRNPGLEGASKAPVADVYYFNPEGKKFRSMPRIIEYLSCEKIKGLSGNCFTFTKRPIFRPPSENVRHANANRSRLLSLNSSAIKLPLQKQSKSHEKRRAKSMPPDEPSSEVKRSKKAKPVDIVSFPSNAAVANTGQLERKLPQEKESALAQLNVEISHCSPCSEPIIADKNSEFSFSSGSLSECSDLHPVGQISPNEVRDYSCHDARSCDLSLPKTSNKPSAGDTPGSEVSQPQYKRKENERLLSSRSAATASISRPEPVLCDDNVITRQPETSTNSSISGSVSVGSNGEGPRQTQTGSGPAAESSSKRIVETATKVIDEPGSQSASDQSSSAAACSGSSPTVVVDPFNSSWIGAQILTLPREVANALNPSRPVTVRFNNRSVIVPPSCVAVTAEGVKVLLPPHTLYPTAAGAQQTDPVDLSGANLNGSSSSNEQQVEPEVPVENAPSASPVSGESIAQLETTAAAAGSESTLIDAPNEELTTSAEGMELRNLNADCLLRVFKLLKLRDLIRVSRVCRLWRDVAYDSSLWRSVCIHGLRVTNWSRAVDFLTERNTRSLDVCEDGLDSVAAKAFWSELGSVIERLQSVTHLKFSYVYREVLYAVSTSLPQLKSLIAAPILYSSAEDFNYGGVPVNFGAFSRLTNLETLRLCGAGKSLALPTPTDQFDIADLGKLVNLRDLQLSSIYNINGEKFHFLGHLQQLVKLDIGDCLDWNKETYDELAKLTNLRSLRLRLGGSEPDSGLANALPKLTQLERLELTNFNLSVDLVCALVEMKQLRVLIVCPAVTPERCRNYTYLFEAVVYMDFLERFDWILYDVVREGPMKRSGDLLVPFRGIDPSLKSAPLRTKLESLDFEAMPEWSDGGGWGLNDCKDYKMYLKDVLRFIPSVDVYMADDVKD